MDDFNFDDFLDILNVVPEEPLPPTGMQRSDILLPQGVEWAQHDYPYSELIKMPHLTALAYHITSIELKRLDSKWGNLLVLESHVGEMKLWQFNENRHNKFFGKVLTVLRRGETDNTINNWIGDYVVIRQTLNFGKFIASKYQEFGKAGDVLGGQLHDADTWAQEQEEKKDQRRLARIAADNRDWGWESDYEDMDWHPGHPSNYGDK